MKLNKQKWIQEVRRVEAEIKKQKEAMHVPHYETTFSYSKLFALKAEATRLYALRRAMKKKTLQLKSFWHFYQSIDRRYTWSRWKNASGLTPDEATAFILDCVPGWKDSFLIDEPAPAIIPQDVSQEAVVS